MGRPPLPVGAHGEITATRLKANAWEARCKYRDLNGEIRRPSSRGSTAAAAKNALRAKIAEMSKAAAKGADLSGEDRFRKAADMWVENLEHKVRHETMAEGTKRTYVSMLDNHVRPRLDKLRLRAEVKVGVCDKLIKDKRDELGLASAKTVRTIMSSVLGLAVRHGALDTNPVRSVEALRAGGKDTKPVAAMTFAQVEQMWTGLRAYAERKQLDAKGRRLGKRGAVWGDLADLSEAMIATGVRIGEVLAISGEDIGRDGDGATTVLVDWHIVRETGRGLVRKRGRKGGKPGVLLHVPSWSTSMWRDRKLAAGTGPVFAAIDGGWLDPSNTIGRLRSALDESGFEWVTSHVWRHTVATLLDEAGLTTTEIADQLGNTAAVVEKHYRAKRVRNTKAASALQSARTG